MTTSFANGTKINFTWQLLEQNVFGDVAYNIGAFHNDAILGGAVYTNNGYFFSRMIRGYDGVWLVDKNIGGYFDNKSVVDPNAKGPTACYKQIGNNVMTNQQITNQSNAYTKALTSGNTDEVSKFWTEGIHFYGEGLDVNRDGLYQYYRQFFQTGSIQASNVSLKYRYVHGNVVYDIGQSEDTVIINGAQSIKKHNYIIRWEKEHDKVWRISRIMNLHRD
jgi:ketosteroid isomerase-like protein